MAQPRRETHDSPGPSFSGSGPSRLTRDAVALPGHFLGNWLLGLALQAEALGAVSPDDHQVKAQIVADREAAWVAALEAEAMQPGVWGLTGDPDDPEATGSP